MAEIHQDVMRTISVLREAYTESALVAFIVPKKYVGIFNGARHQYTHSPGGQSASTHNHTPIWLSGFLHVDGIVSGFVSFQDVDEISLVPILLKIEGEEYK
jgi:hypothetical protein